MMAHIMIEEIIGFLIIILDSPDSISLVYLSLIRVLPLKNYNDDKRYLFLCPRLIIV